MWQSLLLARCAGLGVVSHHVHLVSLSHSSHESLTLISWVSRQGQQHAPHEVLEFYLESRFRWTCWFTLDFPCAPNIGWIYPSHHMTPLSQLLICSICKRRKSQFHGCYIFSWKAGLDQFVDFRLESIVDLNGYDVRVRIKLDGFGQSRNWLFLKRGPEHLQCKQL